MRRSKIIPALLLCLLLTACGGEESGSGRNSFWDTLGMDAEEIVLTVNGREIPAWRYAYWLSMACRTVESACGTMPDWEQGLEDGTLGSYVESQALEDTLLYAAVEERAASQGVCVTSEPGGEQLPCPEGFPLEAWQRQELDAVGQLYRQLLARAAEEVPETFAAERGILTVSRLRFPAGEDGEAARKQAEETFARINEAADKAAVFDALAEAAGAEMVTCRGSDGTLAAAEEAAVTSLETGQISGILENETGFSILRRLPPDGETLAALWLEEDLREQMASASVGQREACARLTAAAVSRALAAETAP